MAVDYKQSGVDVEAGDALVDWLKATSPPKWPHQDKLVEGIGGFAALFRADFKEYAEPCLVSCTDGVGTKIKLAVHFESYREVAQDLVAMCVNDMVCSGAKPLFFLDYYASGKLRLPAAKEFLAGVREACLASDCALIGGETAEMPGVYEGNDFDCAGFSVGVVDRARVLGAKRVKAGMKLVGIGSNGFHSNGFSLLRKVFAADLDQWKAELLKPTHLYVRLVQAALNVGGVQAIAHITGGGMNNVPRVLPQGLIARLNPWRVPAPFLEVKRRSGMAWMSMLGTLNCGVGMVWVVEPDRVAAVKEVCRSEGHVAFDLGEVVQGSHPEGWELTDPSWEGLDA
ncbi:MAG TPA: phosphoribosylformylglycinamidine cyclo-ligase [Bdellovibrionales bacterium]|nr:phosphoribosylformylglycinamidine cyclo-ligase [Bdellovibrionales bacterium]